MEEKGFIWINDLQVPSPDRGLNLVVSTNVSDGKNSNGEFVGQKIGRDQDKIDSLQWKFLTAEQWSAILREFDEFVVLVKFPDMVNNCWKTQRMYPGNRTASPWAVNPDTGLPSMYKDCKVNIVDCGVN